MFTDAILRRHGCHRDGCGCRTWPPCTGHGLHILLGHSRLLPDCLLGVECRRLGLRLVALFMLLRLRWVLPNGQLLYHQLTLRSIRCNGLRWRRPRRDRLRFVGSSILNGPRKAPGEDDDEFPTTQRISHHARHRLPLVRLARLQWRLFLWRQLESNDGLLELQPYRHVRCCRLGHSRLEVGTEVVDGRLVLRYHLRSCCGHSCFWLYHPVGIHCSWCRDWSRVQLQHEEYVFLNLKPPAEVLIGT